MDPDEDGPKSDKPRAGRYCAGWGPSYLGVRSDPPPTRARASPGSSPSQFSTFRADTGALPSGRGTVSAGRQAKRPFPGPASVVTPSPAPEFSIVVPVYNARRYLRDSLGALEAIMASERDLELIVADNGSTDGSREWVESEYGGRARILQVPGTIGAVRNAGARMAGGKYLVFLDADCVVGPDYLQRARDVFRQVPQAAATGAMYALPPHPHWIEKTWQELHRRTGDGWVNYLNSGNLIVRRDAFQAVGGFDEQLTTGEDSELGQRLNEAGYPIYEAHLVRAAHLGNPKSLGHFFRKQAWHAEGMFGTARRQPLDKPLLLTLLHLALHLAGLLGLVLLPAGAAWRLAVLLLCSFAAPATAVGFRAAQRGRLYRPLHALLLYHLYFDARLVGLLRALTGRSRRPY
jgi:Glycosyl transferase family 2